MRNIFERYETMDAYILLSAINLKLRDDYGSLDDLCKAHEVEEDKLCARLKDLGYVYVAEENQFKPR